MVYLLKIVISIAMLNYQRVTVGMVKNFMTSRMFQPHGSRGNQRPILSGDMPKGAGRSAANAHGRIQEHQITCPLALITGITGTGMMWYGLNRGGLQETLMQCPQLEYT